MRATIIFVDGAFAESAIDPLLAAGHAVIAAANPCAGSPSTPPASANWVRTVNGPTAQLVAHSCGTRAPTRAPTDATGRRQRDRRASTRPRSPQS